MNRKRIFTGPWEQYALGLIINLLYLLLINLLGTNNPDNYTIEKYTGNSFINSHDSLWFDSLSYIIPAKNFLRYGIFGVGIKPTDNISYLIPAKNFLQYSIIGVKPDSFRTIGYPFIISLCMLIFKSKWVIALQLFQCFLTATIYPLFTKIINLLFNKDNDRRYVSYVYFATIFTGVVFTEVNFIQTDVVFIVFLYLGIFLGIVSYRKKSTWLTILYIIAISFSTLVRPTGTLFPVINIILALLVFKQSIFVRGNLKRVILTTLFFLVTCNLPSIRNYINYDCFTPGNVIGINLIRYYSAEIARIEGNKATGELARYRSDIDTTTNLSAYLAKCSHYTLVMTKQYPMEAIRAFINESNHVFLGNYILKYVGWNFNVDMNTVLFNLVNFKENRVIKYGSYVLAFFYLILWIVFLIALYELFKQKQYTLIALVMAIFFVYIFPGLFSGYNIPRYRLPFDFFLLTLPIRYLYLHRSFFAKRFHKTNVGSINPN